jgi:phytoene dehydrogenase-like protein
MPPGTDAALGGGIDGTIDGGIAAGTYAAPGAPPVTVPVSADVVVVGAGHNGLVCAAYLARAGRSVVVVEARDTVGGCASSVDAVGARVNICNCDHTMVLGSGIVEDLGLAAHGLTYLDVDPVSVGIGWGDEPVFVQWRDVGRTVEGLHRVDPAAATAYRRYLDDALPVARLLLAATGVRPGALPLVAAAARLGGRGAPTMLAWSRRSLVQVLTSYGLPDWVVASAATTGPAVWGLPPDTPGTGIAAAGFATRHLGGVGRPVGGSGALPDALARAVVAWGGTVLTGRRVAGVVVEGDRTRGVRLEGGEVIAATTVVSATDPRSVIVEWLSGVPAAAALRRTWAARPVVDGYESKVDAVVDALPALDAFDRIPDATLPAHLHHVATTVISPTTGQQVAAAAALRAHRVSDPPMLLLNIPSVLDPAMVPEGGGHVVSLEALWTPYALPGGWAGSPEPWRWMERIAAVSAPGFLDGVRDWRVMTPEDYERDFAMARGYAPSFPGGPVAALLGRSRELSRYETPVKGLFLTGAATFPGAGVWGASGRNTAGTVLRRSP